MTHISLSDYYFKVHIPIRFGDLNAYGIVNHDVYLTYLEIAQSGYWHNIAHWKNRDQGIIIARQNIDYISPLTANEDLHVYVKALRADGKMVKFSYILVSSRKGHERISAKAESFCSFYDYTRAKSIVFPEFLLQKVRAFEGLG